MAFLDISMTADNQEERFRSYHSLPEKTGLCKRALKKRGKKSLFPSMGSVF